VTGTVELPSESGLWFDLDNDRWMDDAEDPEVALRAEIARLRLENAQLRRQAASL